MSSSVATELAEPTRLLRGATSLLILLQCAAVVTAAVGQDTSSAHLRGRVTSRSEVPLAAAEVTLLQASRTALTDSGGRFVLTHLTPGEYVVRVRRIGFHGQYFSAALRPGEDKDVTIVLERGSYELPEIQVTARAAKPIEYAYTHKYDDFFRRRLVGLGRYITREDIEFRRPYRSANLLAGIAGIRIRFNHPGASGTLVEFARCNLPGDRVSVWIDGWKQRYPEFEAPRGGASPPMQVGIYLDRVFPSQIEMMEIYRGPAEMPAEFLDDSCAAIVIWTR